MTINKNAQSSVREPTKEIVRQVREPFRTMTPDDRINRLKGIRDALKSPSGNMTYSVEQQQQLRSYQDLFDNWDNYKEYVNKPMQDLGDWVAEKTVVPAVKAVMSLGEGVKEHGVPGTPDRDKAIKELERSSKYASLYDITKNGINISDLQCFEQTYSALNNNEFHKIASGKVIAEDIASAFRKEIDASHALYHQKFSEEYTNNLDLDLDTYNKFYELAVAHHVLTQEGFLKDAKTIDNFVLRNTSIWGFKKEAGWLGDAWRATKSVISKGFGLIKGIVAKGWKFIVTKLPVLGLVFSVPFMIKNLIEAYHNGKRIISELDLPKFGFDRMKSITPLGLSHVRETFKSAVDKHRRDPDALKELITIFRTIGAFWIDTLFTITNGFMAVLDIIAVAGLFFPGVGWLVSVGAMGANWLLAIGTAGLEVGAEYFKDHYWDKDAAYMLEEAKKAVKELLSEGTVIKAEDPIVGRGFGWDEDEPSTPVYTPTPDPAPIYNIGPNSSDGFKGISPPKSVSRPTL